MTFREFTLRVMAYERTESKQWERFRWVGLKILEPYLEKNSKLTVFDLLPLPTDPTKEELKELMGKRNVKGQSQINKLKEKLTQMGYKV